jgi:predicted RNase H-like HicB family nuclease
VVSGKRGNVKLQPSVAIYESCGEKNMQVEFTAVYQKVPEGYIAFVEELPGANTQGATLDEARSNLREAVEMILEANRTLAEEAVSGEDVVKEPLLITSP